MTVRYRFMVPDDVPKCVAIVAEHPVIGPRYEHDPGMLCAAWLRLLNQDAKRATVFELSEGSAWTICAVGVSVFVNDAFVREIKSAPLFWIGPELAKRIVEGNSPLLSNGQLSKANSRSGMNLVCWEGLTPRRFANNGDVHRAIVNSFVEEHRGFLWKELIASQAESVDQLRWLVNTGGSLWDPAGKRYLNTLPPDPHKLVCKPHIVGITRTIEASRGAWSGSWVGALFKYDAPRFGFTPGEQKLLSAALASEVGTDQELAHGLKISMTTVKKVWLSIYARVTDSLPKLVPDFHPANLGGSTRGKEKRRRLLAYLREHPEELRPASRKSAE